MLEVIVIGGDACGASAASAVKRALRDDVHVVVLGRQPWTSYSACGIPYWLAGQVDGPDGLVARTPEQHRANGLDLRTGWEATAIDSAGARSPLASWPPAPSTPCTTTTW